MAILILLILVIFIVFFLYQLDKDNTANQQDINSQENEYLPEKKAFKSSFDPSEIENMIRRYFISPEELIKIKETDAKVISRDVLVTVKSLDSTGINPLAETEYHKAMELYKEGKFEKAALSFQESAHLYETNLYSYPYAFDLLHRTFLAHQGGNHQRAIMFGHCFNELCSRIYKKFETEQISYDSQCWRIVMYTHVFFLRKLYKLLIYNDRNEEALVIIRQALFISNQITRGLINIRDSSSKYFIYEDIIAEFLAERISLNKSVKHYIIKSEKNIENDPELNYHFILGNSSQEDACSEALQNMLNNIIQKPIYGRSYIPNLIDFDNFWI